MNIMDFILGRKKDLISLIIDEAIGLMERGEHDEAITVLRERALAREPEHRRAQLHLGVAYMMKGDWPSAETILWPIARRRPMDSESAAASIALEKIEKDRAREAGL